MLTSAKPDGYHLDVSSLREEILKIEEYKLFDIYIFFVTSIFHHEVKVCLSFFLYFFSQAGTSDAQLALN